jgi:histidinol-phosphate aminotransferase
MTITRRKLLFGMGAAAAVGVAAPVPAVGRQLERGLGRAHSLPAWWPFAAPAEDGPVLLNSNENPYGPFPSVLAMRDPLEGANRYPDHRSGAITEKIAAINHVTTDRVVTGCGSTEILRMCAEAFSGPRRKVVMAAPTFEALAYYAETANAQVVKVPLTAKYEHDAEAMLKAAGSDAGLVYICNPNNPTASVTPFEQIHYLLMKLPRTTYVLVDEAYHDFAEVPVDSSKPNFRLVAPAYVSLMNNPAAGENVIVARTFSKIYGLAGMRLGYAVATRETAQKLRAQKLEDDLNATVIRCALTSLDDTAGHEQARQRNQRDREEFMRQAQARGLKTIPSFTNFVMVETGRPVRSVIGHFRKNGVEIGRPFPPFDNWARISLGTPEQMTTFWRVWDMMGASAGLHPPVRDDFAWRGGVC